MAERIEIIRSARLDGVAHGFFGRKGGISRGAIAGLNVGFGADDDLAAVHHNRKLAAQAVLPGARLVSVHQIHSSDVRVVDEPWDETDRPHADALVTDRPGMLLGIVTADCAPILLADKAAGVIGIAHAGWRGAQGGVAQATVAAMETLGAASERIIAAIGPCIGQASYEVGKDFLDAFDQASRPFFQPGRAGHWQFDLEAYVAQCLENAGVFNVERLGLDTYSDEERFFSYRRSTHRQEANYGRQFSLIGL